MCGIAGGITIKPFNNFSLIEEFKNSLAHRGPDDNGHYCIENAFILNTRLSIIDLDNGSQPFTNDNEEIIVVQNGEIYNFIELRDNLISKGVIFKTNSDTEVILKIYEFYGTDGFSKLNGMFSVAIIDKRYDKLILLRDRLGVKPLYIYENENELYFSSEIKSFLKIQNFKKDIDYQSIHNYLKFNYIPVPKTIFKGVTHLLPGTFLEISTKTLTTKCVKYWDIKNNKESNFDQSTILDDIDRIMYDAIKIRLRSDVGIGSFLSGGLDSSLICSMTKKLFGVSMDTYSIGFDDKRFDESYWSKKVSNYCGSKNKNMILHSDVISQWEKTTFYNDQPHGDISFIPTYILSEFTSKDYKVVLTGDGGDEAFAGYEKYFNIPTGDYLKYFNSISLIKDDKIFNQLYTDSFKELVKYDTPFKIFNETVNRVSEKDFINQILYFDMKHLLPGNNLVKPDKMAMANSLETRSPMLDYRLFEYVNTLPGNYKMKDNTTKFILKKFAMRYLPEDIVYRKKQMFTVPVGEWFKDSLKEYLEELLLSDKLIKRGIFNKNYLKKMIHEHTHNKNIDYTRELRAIANLELWFRIYMD